jgi:hypothetical protein
LFNVGAIKVCLIEKKNRKAKDCTSLLMMTHDVGLVSFAVMVREHGTEEKQIMRRLPIFHSFCCPSSSAVTPQKTHY